MANQAVMDATEATLDTIESTLDQIENIPAVVKNNKVVLIVVAASSLAVGAGVATFIANKRYKLKYEEITNREIAEAKQFYKRLNKVEEFSDPIAMAEHYGVDASELQAKADEPDDVEPEDYAEDIAREADLISQNAAILEKQSYTNYSDISTSEKAAEESDDEPVEVVQEVTVKTTSVFDNFKPVDIGEYSEAYELEKKEHNLPYIVDEAHFLSNPDQCTELQYIYFAGDDVLCDGDGMLIRDIVGAIGENNLHFGRGSGDRNLVYIQNDRLDQLIEVAFSNGEYAVDYHGEEPTQDIRNPVYKGNFTRPVI